MPQTARLEGAVKEFQSFEAFFISLENTCTIYFGKLDVIVHFLSSMLTNKVALNHCNSLIAPFTAGGERKKSR